MSTSKTYDVIIIGGGHAGIEAAHAAATMGSKALLVTLSKDKIGWMPCNPSVGGLGKGHIVFEISALGGLMPQLCTPTHLQARMLNTSKGPAVQGLRLQIDKFKYAQEAQKKIETLPNLTIYEGMAQELLIEEHNDSKKISGIRTNDGTIFLSSAVVITTGTFLNGTIHVGLSSSSAGRMGEAAAIGLSASLAKALNLTLGRLKTGTPPRLLRSSLNYEHFEKQTAHELDHLFEFEAAQSREKIPCYITYTNEKTHEIIRSNLHLSAMYSGNIKGVGPRYCPSIEDKIGRFADKTSHHVFIEPEGEGCDEVYPAGLSTSLPLDVQYDYIRSIKGFENAIISKAGYAVEYDFIQPTHLMHTLESKKLAGLFCAGQINGTTGYEEAAGQGIIAGINAHQKAHNKEPFILSRTESYIGVMIDDLITLGADEPYRMFTSRAERRLLLRQDNAFFRLTPYAYSLGLISDEHHQKFILEKQTFEIALEHVRSLPRTDQLYMLFFCIEFDKERSQKAKQLLLEAVPSLHKNSLTDRVLLGIHAEIKYAGYMQRELREVEKMKQHQNLHIPSEIEYRAIPGLSKELQGKLEKAKPETIAQAMLIQGMTPAAISILIFHIRMKMNKKKE